MIMTSGRKYLIVIFVITFIVFNFVWFLIPRGFDYNNFDNDLNIFKKYSFQEFSNLISSSRKNKSYEPTDLEENAAKPVPFWDSLSWGIAEKESYKILFMKNVNKSKAKIFDEEKCKTDKILNQFVYNPYLSDMLSQKPHRALKYILTYNFHLWDYENPWPKISGQSSFEKLNCLVDDCFITNNLKYFNNASAVIVRDLEIKIIPSNMFEKRPKNQIWIYYTKEPASKTVFVPKKIIFNWTATYRTDSDLPIPYYKWLYYDQNVTELPVRKNFANGKIKKVAMFVSNCHAFNKRLEYARALSKYIEVDIFGRCGTKTCERNVEKDCFNLLKRDYKFYLAFENSNCRHYITEKLFQNALSNDVIPVVMGAPKKDYENVAPKNSFVHVDDFDSPEELAGHLKFLDQNDEEYNKFFSWKETGELVRNTLFLCRLCAKLHAPQHKEVSYYNDLNTWWNGPGICTKGGPWEKDIV